jgi:hypothetical protein
MNNSAAFNPARFTDIIREDDYRVWTSGVALRKERSELIDWLRQKDALGRAGVTWFIGGSDWSFNEHDEDRYPRHISHPFYGFTASTDDVQSLKRDLQELFPKTDAIPRPVKVQEWDGKKKPIRYMAKSKFFRRIGSDEGQRFNKTNGNNRSCRATDKQPLRSSQKRELLLHLDQIGLQGRLILRWLQILNLGTAGSAVVERGPYGRVRVKG